MNKFQQEVERNEEATRERLQSVKDGLVKWQQFFRNNTWVFQESCFSDYMTSCLITQSRSFSRYISFLFYLVITLTLILVR